MVEHTFNSSTGEAENYKSLTLRPVLPKEHVSEQSHLGSKGQKTGKDIIEQGGHVPTPVSNRTWQFWSCGSGFKVKDRQK